MKHILTILVILLTAGFAQGQDRDLVQFSGVIYNVDSNVVVPYVTVTNKSARNKVFSANHQGYFSFVAHEGDTIVFSAVGYRREALVIPQDVQDRKYTVIVKMQAVVVNLPTVRVLPWTSIDEFNREFMAMKIADDDLEIAKKNVARTSILAMSRSLPRDAQEIGNINFQNNHVALTNRNFNQRASNPLLNPLAWGAFIKQILEGDKSRSGNN
ncbi:hypothetical protein [Pedobacter sp. SYSU D00535]|uniref:hypothetical protein n=1 Tax=Pedobacter sp. SYSU D00535 TaxID=2810308 RepID=UPI001A969A98|nr:hypothetical protein [Pedobacter sp. SYSU D00535]